MTQHSSADQRTIAHFAKDSGQWWQEDGPFAPLHALNPTRLAFITAHTGELKGKRLLDIGCGGGLISEPMARLGADVTGMDADANAIMAAKAHADAQGLNINYRIGMPEDLLADKTPAFDIVLALEIIEHVTDADAFIAMCAKLLKPGGTLICSTLNRTLSSYALGILAAEYVLRWVPPGTHQWKAFVRPAELARHCRTYGLNMKAVNGITYNALRKEFKLSDKDMKVNYIAAFTAV